MCVCVCVCVMLCVYNYAYVFCLFKAALKLADCFEIPALCMHGFWVYTLHTVHLLPWSAEAICTYNYSYHNSTTYILLQSNHFQFFVDMIIYQRKLVLSPTGRHVMSLLLCPVYI